MNKKKTPISSAFESSFRLVMMSSLNQMSYTFPRYIYFVSHKLGWEHTSDIVAVKVALLEPERAVRTPFDDGKVEKPQKLSMDPSRPGQAGAELGGPRPITWPHIPVSWPPKKQSTFCSKQI